MSPGVAPSGLGCPTFNSISGDQNTTQGASETYSVSLAGGSGYSLVWSTSDGSPITSGQAGQFPTVLWNNIGSQELRLAIYASNGSLCSYHVYNVTVANVAVAPGVSPGVVSPGVAPSSCSCPTISGIGGSNSVNENSSQGYVANIVGGSNYSIAWGVSGGTITSGQGTANATVLWGADGTGNINVTVSCNGSTCDQEFMTVTINDVVVSPAVSPASCTCPSATGSPSGNANPVQNTSETYSAVITGGSGYTLNWSVTGGTVTSGQGTTSATILWGSAGTGNVSIGVFCNNTLCSSGFGFTLVTITT